MTKFKLETPDSICPPPLPDPLPAPGIPRLRLGRVVLLVTNSDYRVGIISQVHDRVTGDVTVFVFEPIAPPRSLRLTYAGVDVEPQNEATWAWLPGD
jgi:hypothetical protein